MLRVVYRVTGKRKPVTETHPLLLPWDQETKDALLANLDGDTLDAVQIAACTTPSFSGRPSTTRRWTS
jgi:hypothetical protein